MTFRGSSGCQDSKAIKARKGTGELEGALVTGFGSRGVWERIAAMDAAVHQLIWDTGKAATSPQH